MVKPRSVNELWPQFNFLWMEDFRPAPQDLIRTSQERWTREKMMLVRLADCRVVAHCGECETMPEALAGATRTQNNGASFEQMLLTTGVSLSSLCRNYGAVSNGDYWDWVNADWPKPVWLVFMDGNLVDRCEGLDRQTALDVLARRKGHADRAALAAWINSKDPELLTDRIRLEMEPRPHPAQIFGE